MAGRSRQYDHLLKYVIVGESSVGKSSLLLRFADDQFNENYMTTIGVDFRFKTVNCNNKNIKLQIWDTAGQQRFRTITNTYYKSAHAVILVYDITDSKSLQCISDFWLNQVQSYADPGTRLILVGNKSDLKNQRAITEQKASQFAKSKNMLFFQTSAKTAQHVNDTFMTITSQLITNLEKTNAQKKQRSNVTLNNNNNGQGANNKKQGCCY